MKRIILSTMLGLMSAVAFAQTPSAPQGEPHPHHTKAQWQEAREACKTQVMSSKPADKKAGHEAFRQCMESKGFKHHPRHHDSKPGQPPLGKPVPPVAPVNGNPVPPVAPPATK